MRSTIVGAERPASAALINQSICCHPAKAARKHSGRWSSQDIALYTHDYALFVASSAILSCNTPSCPLKSTPLPPQKRCVAISFHPFFLSEDPANHTLPPLHDQFAPRTRALTDPLPAIVVHDEMTTFSQPPGSPPDLTSSKSSKSSSLSTSNIDAVLTDLSHFEDIGLEDDAANTANFNRNKSAGNDPTRSSPATIAAKNQVLAAPVMRELVNGAPKSSLVQTSGFPQLARQGSPLSLNLPNGGSRSQTSPNLALHDIRNKSQSRSPSPTHLNQRPVSPSRLHSIASGSAILRSNTSPNLQKPRRESTNKPRKTAKEIEAEYNDSDEDLPDDASLWNVPLSPGLFRTASSQANSTNASASTSPERPSYLGSSPNLTHLRPAKTAPIISKPFSPSLTQQSVPSSPISPRMIRGASTGALEAFTFGKTRAKSWSNVLSDLSEDAIALSEALDQQAADAEQNSNGDVKFKENVFDKRRVKSSIVELPPLRRNNVMIDPLPISREKEKVLSRTRPSWLPPKSQKEEKKHLKEYQRMMEASIEADKKRAAKAVSARCIRDDTTAMLQRIWDEHVLPNWSAATHEPRTRELWWRGIPAGVRTEVWKRAITNELGLTPNTYAKALARARTVEAGSLAKDNSTQDVPKEATWLRAIRRDVRQAFPALHLFQKGQPLHEVLIDLLSAYAMYRSDIGYVYGTHLPAAILLLTMPSATEAFTSLANLLNRPLPLAFMTGDVSGTSRTYELILNLLQTKRAKLYHHLFGAKEEGGLSLAPHDVFEPMIRTLFLNGCCDAEEPIPPTPMTAASIASSFPSFSFTLPSPRSPKTPLSPTSAHKTSPRGLSLPLVQRLWDVIVFDGDAAIIRACAGILAAKESTLYGNAKEVLEVVGWNGALRLGETMAILGYQAESETEEETVDTVMGVIRGIGKENRKKAEKNGQ